MTPLVGGLIGAVLAVVAITGWNGRAVDDEAWVLRSPATGVERASHAVAPVAAAAPAGAEPGPLSVRCEPGQRAVVRQLGHERGGLTTEAACVTDPAHGWATPAPYVPADTFAPAAPAPRALPATYRVEEPQPAPTRVVYRDAPAREVYREAPARRVEPEQRSWKKTALVIGGTAGAGAGIGALAGGKKGALIGAAIGGGGATIYEVAKR
jgi:hypothetical protein